MKCICKKQGEHSCTRLACQESEQTHIRKCGVNATDHITKAMSLTYAAAVVQSATVMKAAVSQAASPPLLGLVDMESLYRASLCLLWVLSMYDVIADL
jgi:hypothetical protein